MYKYTSEVRGDELGINPETLDALSFLRQYFIKNKSTSV
jgi:hypothetical protein